MSNKITATLESRKTTGKKVSLLRDKGLVPGVIYGDKIDPKNVQLSQQEAQRLVREAGKHTPAELTIGNKKQMALIKDMAYAPASNFLTHIAFQAVSADDVVTTEIPVVIEDVEQAPATKAGLVIVPAIEQVEVRAKASDLIDRITASADNLVEIGDKLTLADTDLPKNIELVSLDSDSAIATVQDPEAEAEEEASNEDELNNATTTNENSAEEQNQENKSA